MASVGPDLLIAHLPRSGGRSLRHAALHGGLARPLSDSGHHESLESVLKDHGPRRFILGTYRPAAEWYRSIVTASLHWAPQKVWIDAWIECIGSDDPLDLVDAMLGGEGAPDLCGVDSHILSPSPGRSLFESNVISAYMVQDEAGPRVGLTHSIPMSCLPDAALSLGELLGSPLTLPHIRERETPSVSVSDFYRGARGQRLLEQIQERDGWMDDLLGGDWVKPFGSADVFPRPSSLPRASGERPTLRILALGAWNEAQAGRALAFDYIVVLSGAPAQRRWGRASIVRPRSMIIEPRTGARIVVAPAPIPSGVACLLHFGPTGQDIETVELRPDEAAVVELFGPRVAIRRYQT